MSQAHRNKIMTEPIVYLNHEIVPATQAHVKIYDTGVVLGATVTEMVRTFHQRPSPEGRNPPHAT